MNKNFESYRKQVEELMFSDYHLFIKSLISLEYNIEDETEVDSLFNFWLKSDDAHFLSDVIDTRVEEVATR